MKSVDTLRHEHDAVLLVLDSLEPALQAAEQGVPVPLDIFTDVGEFFTVFVDQCHSNKEEAAVFTRIPQSTSGTALVQQLENEHSTGRGMSAAYVAAVKAYRPGDAASGAEVARTARAYGATLRVHIEEENVGLFPSMEQSLVSDDDAMTAEFDRIELEDIGAGTHERIHAMIDTLPARIRPWAEKAGVTA
jgi:hemerythrin-like domain-containing protein